MKHSSLAHLPNAFFAMVPELATLDFPEEKRATCETCPVSAKRDERTRERPFDVDVRCCTFHPNLRNYAAGQALERGGASARAVRRRLQDPRGITALTIEAPEVWTQEYLRNGHEIFGKNLHYTCPFYAGDQGCTVWRDRNAVCRTWFCKHVDGRRSVSLWERTKVVIGAVEKRLALWCIVAGEAPPKEDWAKADVMEAWYLWCAKAVREAHPKVVSRMRDESLESYVAELTTHAHAMWPELPDLVRPSVNHVIKNEDGSYALTTQRMLDRLQAPADIFQFLSRLDHKTTWQAALVDGNKHMTEPIDADFVMRMFRRGLLEEVDPTQVDVEPGMTLKLKRTKADGGSVFMHSSDLDMQDIEMQILDATKASAGAGLEEAEDEEGDRGGSQQ